MRYLIVVFTFLLSVTFYGQNDYSMSFDGVDDYVQTSLDGPAGNSARTFQFWLKTNNLFDPTGAANGLIAYGSETFEQLFEINFGTYGLEIHTYGAWAHFEDIIIDNNYHHYALVIPEGFNIDEAVLYQDGEVYLVTNSDYAEWATSLSLNTSNEFPIQFGKNLDDYNSSEIYQQLDGQLDEISIWSSTLTQEQIQNYMSCPPTGNEEGLVGYWNFEEGSGTTAYDLTGNGNDGVINGATYSTDVPEQNCIDQDCSDMEPNFNFIGSIDDCCYYTYNDTTSWTEANAICENYEGSLVTINNSNESDLLNNLLGNPNTSNGNQYWINLIDGESEWNNGDTLDFTNYDTSYVSEEDDYMFLQNNGYWDNSPNDGSGSNTGIYPLMEICQSNDSEPSNSSGCTDDQACNFNENAVEDDGSCEYITPVDLGEDITTCDESITLDAGEGYDSYLWSNGETTQSIEVSESGDYSVEVGNGDENNASLSFDGEDDHVTGSSGPDLLFTETNKMTLSAWIKPSSIESLQFVFNHNGGNGADAVNYGLILSSGQIYFVAGPDWFESDGVFNLSENQLSIDVWSHITVTYDGNAIRFYLNGQLDFENYVSDEFEDTQSGGFQIGQRSDGQYRFNGNIDEINIWNQSLTQNEIQQYMNCPPTGNEEGLVGYWNFDEGSGTTVYDQSENANIGLINGATWSDDTPEQNCSACSSSDDITITINPSGCTDASACNFNDDATCDDGSCEYITPVDLGEDITTCDESVTLDAGEGYDSYLWSNGGTTQTIEVSESGDYSVEAQNIMVGNVDSWTLFFHEDFEQEFSPVWNVSEVLSYNDNSVLGKFGENDLIIGTFLDLEPHTQLRVEFDLYIIDSWDGNLGGVDGPDQWFFQIDGNELIATTFANNYNVNNNNIGQSFPENGTSTYNPAQTGASMILASSAGPDCCDCGYSTAVYSISKTINHDLETVSLLFTDGLSQSLCDESWAIDNVKIYLDDQVSCSSSDDITVTINVCGCTDSEAVNYNIEANEDDSSCCYDIDYVNDTYDEGYADGVDSVICPENNCPSDLNLDGIVSTADLLMFLVSFGTICE